MDENNAELLKAKDEAAQWRSNFQRVVTQIMVHMQERFQIHNQAYSYRKVLENVLREQGHSEKDIQDFIRLEVAEAYLQERLRHKILP